MIIQTIFFLFIYVLGAAISVPFFHNTQNQNYVPVFAFFIGTSVYSILLFLVLFIQGIAGWTVSYSFWLLAIFLLLTLTYLFVKNRVIYIESINNNYKSFLLFTGIIFFSTLVFSFFNYTVVSYDSYRYLELGEGLAVSGFKVDNYFIETGVFKTRALFYSLFHALSRVFNIDYLWAFIPTYSICFILAFYCLLSDMIKTITGNSLISRWITLFATLFILSSQFAIFNFFYINNHLFTTVHFTLFFLVTWRGLYFKDNKLIYLATILLVPTILMRLENVIILPIFVAIILPNIPKIQTIRKLITLIGFCVSIYSFLYLLNLYGYSSHGGFINAEKISLMLFSGLLCIIFGQTIGRVSLVTSCVENCKRYSSSMILTMLTFAVCVTFFVSYETSGISLPIVVTNLFDIGIWGHFWYIVSFMTLLLYVITGDRDYSYRDFFTSGILIFVLLTIELAFLRSSAYRLGWGDSANRMMLHIVPLIVAHLSTTVAVHLSFKNDENSVRY